MTSTSTSASTATHAAPAGRRTASCAIARWSINGVSKTYAMTGWRIGWAAGPRDLIQALDTLLSQSAGNCCSVSQAAAAAALNGDQCFVADSVAIYQAAARQDAGADQRHPRPSLPRARRRVLPVRQLRRPDRQDDARRASGWTATATWSCTCSRARACGRRRRRPTACRRTSACRSRPSIEILDEGCRPHRRAVADASLRTKPMSTDKAIRKHPLRRPGRRDTDRRSARDSRSRAERQLHRNIGAAGLQPYHRPTADDGRHRRHRRARAAATT